MNLKLAMLLLVAVIVGSVFTTVTVAGAATGYVQHGYDYSSATPHPGALYALSNNTTTKTVAARAVVQEVKVPEPSAEVPAVAAVAPAPATINATSIAAICSLGAGVVIVLAIGLHKRRKR